LPVLLLATVFELPLAGSWEGRALAADGRDFSAIYSLGPAVAEGDQLRLAFSIGISNHTGEGIAGAVVRISECGIERREVGASAPADLPSGLPVRVAFDIVLAPSEHEAWQQGCVPRIEVSYVDGEGQERRTPAEAAGPVTEGE
jgi:hypothetical protein